MYSVEFKDRTKLLFIIRTNLVFVEVQGSTRGLFINSLVHVTYPLKSKLFNRHYLTVKSLKFVYNN